MVERFQSIVASLCEVLCEWPWGGKVTLINALRTQLTSLFGVVEVRAFVLVPADAGWRRAGPLLRSQRLCRTAARRSMNAPSPRWAPCCRIVALVRFSRNSSRSAAPPRWRRPPADPAPRRQTREGGGGAPEIRSADQSAIDLTRHRRRPRESGAQLPRAVVLSVRRAGQQRRRQATDGAMAAAPSDGRQPTDALVTERSASDA